MQIDAFEASLHMFRVLQRFCTSKVMDQPGMVVICGVGEFANKSATGAASLDYVKFRARDEDGCWHSLPEEVAPAADLITTLKLYFIVIWMC